MKELVKIDAKDFGLEESKAQEISNQFKPMLDKMVELEKEANEVFSLDIEDSDSAKKAKEVRLKYVKVRTGTSEIHKQQKAFYLAGGRFVDGWKNAQIFASQGIEERLESIEKYAENKEKERLQAIQNERIELLYPFVDSVDGLNLSQMEDDVWQAFFSTKKRTFEDRIEAERKAEAERIAELKRQEEEREAQRLENERLKKEAKEREAIIKKEREESEAKQKAIQEEADKKAREEKAKQDAILKAEREAKEKIEAELRLKKEAEEKAEKERIKKLEAERKEAEKLAKAPIKKQLNNWVDGFNIDLPNSELLNNETALEIKNKFEVFKNWAKTQVNNL